MLSNTVFLVPYKKNFSKYKLEGDFLRYYITSCKLASIETWASNVSFSNYYIASLGSLFYYCLKVKLLFSAIKS